MNMLTAPYKLSQGLLLIVVVVVIWHLPRDHLRLHIVGPHPRLGSKLSGS